MKNNTSKGSEPLAIKAVIIMMSLLYILSPLHLEMNKLVHTIVHAFEMPDTILSHQNRADVVKTHNSYEHRSSVVEHNHEVIEFLEVILEGSDGESESSNALIKAKKIDKHFKVREDFDREKELAFSAMKKEQFKEKENKLCKGHPICFGEPPKV